MAINFQNDLTPKESFVGASSGYTVFDSGIYDATIKNIYFTKSMSGTVEGNVTLNINNLDKDFKLYVCFKETGTPVKTVNGNKIVMPGFKVLNSLVYCATGKTLEQLPQQPKTIQITNRSTQTTEPKSVDALVGIEDKQIQVALKKMVKHKTAKVNGMYVPTTETYEINEIDVPFTLEGFSAEEKAKGTETALNKDKWEQTNSGKVFTEKLKVEPIDPPKSLKEQALSSAGKAVSIDDLLNSGDPDTDGSVF